MALPAESSPAPGGVLLDVAGLTKRFGGTLALDRVDFRVETGTVHAFLGENGAGKSTLIKVLAGVHLPDGGQVSGPAGSLRPGQPLTGVAFVHQDLGLVDTLSVAENIALGIGFPRRFGLIDWRAAQTRAGEVLRGMELDFEPDEPVGRLGAAEKSMVAIARAVAADAQVLILDEPTATLPTQDVEALHHAIRRLTARGMGIVYVTHRLDEVFQIADQVTVLRDGRCCHTGAVADCSSEELVAHIIGRGAGSMFPTLLEPGRNEVLDVHDLRSKTVGPVSFKLHAAEVLGLVGLRNSGQDTAGRLIAGALMPRGGSVQIAGKAVPPGDLRAAIAAGLGFVSSKRVEESLAMGMNIRENLFLDPGLLELKRINTRHEAQLAHGLLDRFGVRPPQPERLISTLSGGNQQKVVLGRWLETGRRVLVLEEPTIGVDVGARSDIYALLNEAQELGMGVIVISSDFEEIAGLCHRALVFDRGRVVRELARDELTVDRLAKVTGRQEK
ncbi:sugar ABC transporter ATP-binding protein [uncultured Marivita sp.]|uniref:sugar ABC transporter ATP-binding protein n=1 Tax=uncultured Marivita sp. TaxID=888080 RepID=UPI00260370CF|nr:sugar ABC transporter ATP-binding protein [uncultured Marivita sp.]